MSPTCTTWVARRADRPRRRGVIAGGTEEHFEGRGILSGLRRAAPKLAGGMPPSRFGQEVGDG
jgi:hypothetical protein